MADWVWILLIIGVAGYYWSKSKNSAAIVKLKSSLITLVRQAARWSTAAKQDSNSLIAVLHANYGAGYLWALGDIATPEEILTATGVDYGRLKSEITAIQDEATTTLSNKCPNYAPPLEWLSVVAGEGARQSH